MLATSVAIYAQSVSVLRFVPTSSTQTAKACSSNEILEFDFTDPTTIPTGGFISIKINPSITLPNGICMFTFSNLSSHTTDATLKFNLSNNTVTIINNIDGGNYPTHNITLGDGSQLFVQGAISNPAGTPTGGHGSNQISIFKGLAPTFSINSKTQENIVLLNGCEPTIKLEVSNAGNCATDAFALSIQELNPLSITQWGTFPTVGPEIYRNLTSTELTDIISTNGMSLPSNTFDDNNSSIPPITILAGKTYSIKLVYNGLGVFKPTYKILQYKSGSYDLIMKDYTADNGFEPSVGLWSSQTVFESPDLSNISSASSSPNPDFVTNRNNTNKMIGNITNIGCVASPADVPLRMFWTLARTDEVWKNNWTYNPTNNGVTGKVSNILEPLGSEITIGGTYPLTYDDPFGTDQRNNAYNTSVPFNIPAISAGGNYNIPNNLINWFPPNPAEYSPTDIKFNGARPVICLLARINEKTSTNDPISWEPTGTTDKMKPYATNNNNVVTKNLYLYDDETFLQAQGALGWDYGIGSVRALDPGNPNPENTLPKRKICLELLNATNYETNFTNYGSVELILTGGLWNSWANNGYEGSNFTYNAANEGSIYFTSNATKMCLNKVQINDTTNQQIGVRFNYSGTNFPATPINMIYNLTVQMFDTLTSDTNFISADNLFDVTVPTSYPLGAALTSSINKNNIIANNGLELEVFPNPTNTVLNIKLSTKNSNTDNGTITVIDAVGKIIQTYKTYENSFAESIDTKNLSEGIYFVKYQNTNTTLSNKFIVIH